MCFLPPWILSFVYQSCCVSRLQRRSNGQRITRVHAPRPRVPTLLSPVINSSAAPLSNSARHRMRKQGERGGAELRLALSYYYIAYGTRTGGRSRVRTVGYCLYDVYTVRMHRDIAPVRVPTAPATLQSHRHTQNDTDTAHEHALQSCSMRHDLSHMHA